MYKEKSSAKEKGGRKKDLKFTQYKAMLIRKLVKEHLKHLTKSLLISLYNSRY